MKRTIKIIACIMLLTICLKAEANVFGHVYPVNSSTHVLCSPETPDYNYISRCAIRLRDPNGVLVGTDSVNSFLNYSIDFSPTIPVGQYTLELYCPRNPLIFIATNIHVQVVDGTSVERLVNVCIPAN